MLSVLRLPPRSYWLVFLATFAVALLFAAYTNHVWEDYYITYRTSKNVATGHGLVFNHGDKLHTFTSPLGVLLPAVASLLTLNTSDDGALWIFRVMSGLALAGAATLLFATLRHLHAGLTAAAFAAAWLAADLKSVDFAINGMETGFLLLCLAGILYAQFVPRPRRWLWLGLAWGATMWTRPDGFIYIGLLAAGAWLFNDPARSGLTRTAWLKVFVQAGLVCTAVYLPWFLFAWAYYGTPVPHTIAAKAAMSEPKTLLGAIQTLLQLPRTIWEGAASAPGAFLPAYYMFGGWPQGLLIFARFAALVAAFVWVLPFFSAPSRIASFAFCAFHVYLTYFPYFPFPWYMPGTTILGYFVFASVLAQLLAAAAHLASPPSLALRARWLQRSVLAAGTLLLAVNLWWLSAGAVQLESQQRLVETGNRRRIGEWLRAQAQPGDTVFMEPLGYIGFFSQFKTYDFPGMSSREMVEATKLHGNDWPLLIRHLSPIWLVLRPAEADRLERSDPALFSENYALVKEFDVLEAVVRHPLPGRPYLEADARFRVFHRTRPPALRNGVPTFASRFPVDKVMIDGHRLHLVHAPGAMTVAVPAVATTVSVYYGYPSDAYKVSPTTDGARFKIVLADDGRETVLLDRYLNPAAHPADRGLQEFVAPLPARSANAKLVLSTSPGDNDVKDWTSWGTPEFR